MAFRLRKKPTKPVRKTSTRVDSLGGSVAYVSWDSDTVASALAWCKSVGIDPTTVTIETDHDYDFGTTIYLEGWRDETDAEYTVRLEAYKVSVRSFLKWSKENKHRIVLEKQRIKDEKVKKQQLKDLKELTEAKATIIRLETDIQVNMTVKSLRKVPVDLEDM